MSKFTKQFELEWKKKFSEAAKQKGQDWQISLWSEKGLEYYLKYFFVYFLSSIGDDNSQTKVLDLGCGPGTYSKLLAEKGFQVFGVDYSKDMVEVAKEKVTNKKTKFQVGDIYKLPFPDNYFDIVICFGVFQTLDYPKKALKEICRVLKNRGLIMITTLNSLFFPTLYQKKDTHKLYNPYRFKKLLSEEGIDTIQLKGIYNVFPNPIGFITDLIFHLKLYKLFNFLFPLFVLFSNSFHIEGRMLKIKKRNFS